MQRPGTNAQNTLQVTEQQPSQWEISSNKDSGQNFTQLQSNELKICIYRAKVYKVYPIRRGRTENLPTEIRLDNYTSFILCILWQSVFLFDCLFHNVLSFERRKEKCIWLVKCFLPPHLRNTTVVNGNELRTSLIKEQRHWVKGNIYNYKNVSQKMPHRRNNVSVKSYAE